MASDSSSGRKLGCFVKTKMCRFHILGLCVRGSDCVYAHCKEELNALPDFTHTKLCKALRETGACKDRNCLFAHSVDELKSLSTMFIKTKMCHFQQMGHCAMGSKCNFAHVASELRSQPPSADLLPECRLAVSREAPDPKASEVQSMALSAGSRRSKTEKKTKHAHTQSTRKARVPNAHFAAAKPVGLVQDSVSALSPVHPTMSDGESLGNAARPKEDQGRFTAVPVPDSPIYLFQAEPHRPGSFRTIGSSAGGAGELFIGQIADEHSATRAKPNMMEVGRNLEMNLPDSEKFCGLGMGQITNFHAHFGGDVVGDLTVEEETPEIRLGDASEVPLTCDDKDQSTDSARPLQGNTNRQISVSSLLSQDNVPNKVSSHVVPVNGLYKASGSFATDAQGRMPIRSEPEGFWHARNTFLSFAPAVKPMRSVRTADGALCSLAQDSDEGLDVQCDGSTTHA